MQFIDSHTHLYLPQFDDDRDQVISKALDNNVIRMLLPNIDKQSINSMLGMVENYPGICYPMAGVHPTSIKEDYKEQLRAIEESLANHKFIAIGEIGIDLYWDKTYINEQEEAFREQLNIASDLKLPVVIHSRDSLDHILRIIDDEKKDNLKGVFHAFTGNYEDAVRIIERGFHIGIGGIITFKNSDLHKTVEKIDINNILLETDSPYLAPVPKRGKRNESAYISYIAARVAEVKSLPISEVAAVTTANCNSLFSFQ